MTIFIIVAAALVIALFFFRRGSVAPTKSVTVAEIPGIVSQLATTNDGSFAVFMFDSPLSPGGDAVNLQYSVEQRAVGLDWVLLSQTNIADKEKISAFASRMGHPMIERVVNDVHYLRTEGRDLDKLGMNILSELYGVARDKQLDLITEGFEWPLTT
jgi:hypothetical protein